MSASELAARCAITSDTGALNLSDVPMSPCKSAPAQLANRSQNGTSPPQ